MWQQVEITLTSRKRGFHLITDELVRGLPELAAIDIGLAHFFLLHTSASLSINENADASVRHDMEAHFNALAPENAPYYIHTYEGSDDMPAHLKASILGSSVDIPITNGKLNLGTWQGIYLCEHRNNGGSRKLFVTIIGE